MKNNNLVTVITPTYNREHTLKNLYKSLIDQKNKNFIWMVVDDGSYDNTQNLINGFISEDLIKITYIYQNNGGKHRALNTGIKKIHTELTFIVDSDDILTADAVQTIYKNWDSTKNWCGMCFLRGYNYSDAIGDKFKKDMFVDTFINVRLNENIIGDKAEIWVTELLKQVPFPEFENEKFLGENYVWIELSKKYSMLFINKIIYICKYLDDGLTKSGRLLRISCPLGGIANSKQSMDRNFSLKIRIKNTWLYICYSYFAGEKFKDIIRNSGHPILVKMNMPYGYLLYKYWKNRYL